jgi:methionine-rich copper-binding protein CopC
LTKVPAPGLASRARRIPSAMGSLRRSAPLKLVLPTLAVALVVSGLLVGLPVKQAAANQLPTFAPLAPEADAHLSQTNVALDAAFQIQFTKPMNAPSVESALSIAPEAEIKLRWDATNQTLSIRPAGHWEAFTSYEVRVGEGAADLEGLALASPIDAIFETGSLTAGELKATQMVGGMASPRTAFQLTFTRPVKYATVIARLSIFPAVPIDVVGDDPTDSESTVFTITPRSALETGTKYLLLFENGGADSSGSAILPMQSLEVQTLPTPAIVKFTPAGGSVSRDLNQAISVTFSVPMDTKATTAALRVTANRAIQTGRISWSEDDTIMTWTPRRSFSSGTTVGVYLGEGARSTGGIGIGKPQSSTFTISKASTTRIVYKPPTAIKWENVGPQYLSAEKYYLALVNCTRTGGWVISGGYCSTVTHHTRPAQKALTLNAGISDKVARPYAKYMADTCQLNHFLNGTNPHSRLSAAGYHSNSWGENIASPSSASQGGLAAVEVWFQNEYNWRAPNHYTNIMNSHFHSAGVGIWISRCTRLVIDFYG